MKKICFAFLLSAFTLPIFAGEGMWIPLLLKALNEAEMQEMGMKMSAEDIYSVNKGSLKDAIVHFGGYCTGEIISDKGLLLTNHHCGFGAIQSHTTLKNNYLEDGFWAMKQEEELSNPGLFARFIVRIEDVSEAALKGVSADMSETERQSVIDKNINKINDSAKIENWQETMIRPFFKGNQYFLFVTETYNDVRLVGAPPSAIGKFGADTDNWEWPRQTGDFGLFRVYADKNNRPADYSPNNVPLKPRHSLPVSVKGVKEGDFTLVFGFPGRTNEYLPSPAIEQIMNVLDPLKIDIRTKALDVINAEMQADKEVKIKYASKQASVANAWKKWIGESLGLKKTDAVGKKEKLELEFQLKVNANEKWKEQYGMLLKDFHNLYKEIEPYAKTRDYYNEIMGRNIELMRLVNNMNRLVKIYESSGEAGLQSRGGRIMSFLERFYKDYAPEKVDKKLFISLIEIYYNNVTGADMPEMATQMLDKTGRNYTELANLIYDKTMLTDGEKVMKRLQEEPKAFMEDLKQDIAYQFGISFSEAYRANSSLKYNELQEQINNLQRTYMKALMEVFPNKRFYPDANSTMRVTYGKIASYEPRDAVFYQPVSYLKGVMEKYEPGDYEFDVPKKLRDLYEKKDYGKYGVDGKMPVCILGSNHTTGGNSGSPAIDAEGNLVGLNFDRVWEGTMSDYNYDFSICRNIMVDARYILFIVDKYAGAKHLIEEMRIVD